MPCTTASGTNRMNASTPRESWQNVPWRSPTSAMCERWPLFSFTSSSGELRAGSRSPSRPMRSPSCRRRLETMRLRTMVRSPLKATAPSSVQKMAIFLFHSVSISWSLRAATLASSFREASMTCLLNRVCGSTITTSHRVSASSITDLIPATSRDSSWAQNGRSSILTWPPASGRNVKVWSHSSSVAFQARNFASMARLASLRIWLWASVACVLAPTLACEAATSRPCCSGERPAT
mmetsp:Transcript_71519/g.202875  ORF Transcript_71519/g.202875 Transcript_71519/m.202875 type:complete len:236 (-) Transcript_71519:1157-1864(-)